MSSPEDKVDTGNFRLPSIRPIMSASTMDKVVAMGKINAFIDHIQLQFEDDPSRYKEFLSIMKAYQKSRLSYSEVIMRICELLVGYPRLVEEFSAFLPNGCFLVPSDRLEAGEAYVTLKTPEGETVYSQDYSRGGLPLNVAL